MNLIIPKYFTRNNFRLCGIYFLFCKTKLIYIGQTRNLVARLGTHEAYGTQFDSIRFIPCHESKLVYYEKRWIIKFRPKLNYRHLFKMVGPTLKRHLGKRRKVAINLKKAA